jgi:asparagine N-glycosylation enzyme membrane subunit Stt3
MPTASRQRRGTICARAEGAEESAMLTLIAVLLVIMWLLGMVTSYTLGGFIHILLVLAIIAVLVRIIQGRNPI